MERARVLRAARDGAVVVALTVVVVVWEARREAAQELLPADVTLTAPVSRGTDQLQFLVRGAGCDQADTSARGYKKPKERVKAPILQYDEDSIVITYMVEDPGRYACQGFDPGVPRTITLRLPLGDRTILDGTQSPPAPFRTGAPRTLPLDVVPSAVPSVASTGSAPG